MTTIKFVVRVSHTGTRAPAYVQRIGKIPFQMTTNRKLALIMGKLTAEDAAKAIQTSRGVPELRPVQVSAWASPPRHSRKRSRYRRVDGVGCPRRYTKDADGCT